MLSTASMILFGLTALGWSADLLVAGWLMIALAVLIVSQRVGTLLVSSLALYYHSPHSAR